MQQLQFPKPTLAKGDFFSEGGIPPTPIPEALDVLSKYKVDNSEEPSDTEEGVIEETVVNPSYLKGDPKITEGIDGILGKYKGTEDAEDEEEVETKPPASQVPAAKPTTQTPVSQTPVSQTPIEEESGGTDPSEVINSIDFAEVANLLQEKGLIVEIPEGFPIEDVRADNFWELVNHNFNKKTEETYNIGYEEARKEIASGLLPEVLDMVNFQLENPNSTAEEVKMHIEHIFYQKEVSSLDPTDPIEAETIIRQYLTGSGEYTAEEIQDTIQEAKDLNRLEQRAAQFKPKLELRLKQEAQRKQAERNEILEIENANHQSFLTKVRSILDRGDINGIPLGNEEKSKLWGILSNNKIPVPVPGGKTVEMGYMNFLVAKNMYSKDANHENLMLAALILEGGIKNLEKYVSAPAIKKEVAAFKSQAAKGTFRSTPAAVQQSSQKTTKVDPKNFFSRQLR